jgi:ankyrin repeat protein
VLIRKSYLQTALHSAADNGHPSVDILLDYGADAEARGHYGYTPFYRTADQGYDDITRLFQVRMSGIKQ